MTKIQIIESIKSGNKLRRIVGIRGGESWVIIDAAGDLIESLDKKPAAAAAAELRRVARDLRGNMTFAA